MSPGAVGSKITKIPHMDEVSEGTGVVPALPSPEKKRSLLQSAVRRIDRQRQGCLRPELHDSCRDRGLEPQSCPLAPSYIRLIARPPARRRQSAPLQNIRLSVDAANPLSRSRNWE